MQPKTWLKSCNSFVATIVRLRAYVFFQLIAARYEKRSTIFTTNQPFSKWGEVFGDSVIASAIVDRIVHHCEIVKITGQSYRIKGKVDLTKEDN